MKDTPRTMRPQSRRRVRLACALALVAIASLAVWLRCYFVIDDVFAGGDVRFQDSDAYCHMRAVDRLVANFPHAAEFDPYMCFPGGAEVPVAPLLDYVMAATAIVLGGGHPSQRLIDAVGAWTPVILGALTLIPAYFLAAALFGRITGLLAAALLAIAPGNFLRGSLLGYADHHAAEALLATLVMMILVRAIHPRLTDRRSGRAGADLCEPDLKRAALGGAWAGVALGLYLLTWRGGAITVGALVVWLVVQWTLDVLRRRSTGPLAAVGLAIFSIPLLMTAALGAEKFGMVYYLAALLAGLGMTVILWGIERLGARCRWPVNIFPLLVAAAMAVLGVVAELCVPGLVRGAASQFGMFTNRGAADTIREVVPLLRDSDGWTLIHAWRQFATQFFLSIAALLWLAGRAARRGEPGIVLLTVWSGIMLAATLGQNRYSYYYAVNASILSAFLGGALITRCWAVRRPHDRGAPEPSRTESATVTPARWALRIFALVAIAGGWIAPNFSPALFTARNATLPHPDWHSALTWLRENTPEPFGDASAYYGLHAAPPQAPGAPGYVHPPTAYGVMSWWDYGYWIMRVGRRIPTANPTQHAAVASARFFTARSEGDAAAIAREFGVRYVIIDCLMGFARLGESDSLVGKFFGIVQWSGKPKDAFVDTFYLRGEGGALRSVTFYYPDLYRTLLWRLYVFRGLAIRPSESHVVTYRRAADDSGAPIKVVTSLKKFATYEEAADFAARQPPDAARVVGLSAFDSCVPLEAMRSFHLIHQSPTAAGLRLGEPVGYVEIYEYLDFDDRHKLGPPGNSG